MAKLLLIIVAMCAACAAQCPVQIDNVHKLHDGNAAAVSLGFKNTTDKEISKTDFTVAALDSAGEAHPLVGAFGTGKVKSGSRKVQMYPVGREVLDPITKVRLAAWLNSVQFSDGTQWKDDGTHQCTYKHE